MINEIKLKDSSWERPDEGPTVETAENFEELYGILKKMGEIIGSDEARYTADDLIGRIRELREGLIKVQKEEIKKGLMEIHKEGKIRVLKTLIEETIKELIWADENLKILICQITRTKGLRNIVVKLAIDEVITREVSGDINDE